MRKNLKRLSHFLFVTCFKIKSWAKKSQYYLWNESIKPWWKRLWIRKDEFHSSLDTDYLPGISQEEEDNYSKDVFRRRHLSHERDDNIT